MSLFYLADKEMIANRALLDIGASPLISFNDGTPEANIVKQIYPTFVQGLLTRSDWSFAMKQQQLTQLSFIPVAGWQYAYVFPEDCLKIRTFFLSNQTNVLPFNHYQIFDHRRVYTNTQNLWANYITVVNEAQWPYYFTEFVVKALASEIAYPITRDTNLREYYRTMAFGSPAENGYGGMLVEAMTQDSKQNTNPWLPLHIQQDARNYMGGGFYNNY